MVEPGIVNGMVEYVTLAVLSIHRDWRTYLDQQREKSWKVHRVRPASSRNHVGRHRGLPDANLPESCRHVGLAANPILPTAKEHDAQRNVDSMTIGDPGLVERNANIAVRLLRLTGFLLRPRRIAGEPPVSLRESTDQTIYAAPIHFGCEIALVGFDQPRA